jgi:hypothetical protein
MSFPTRTVVDEHKLFPTLPNNNIAPIRPTKDDLWGKDGGSFFYNGTVKTNCPGGLVWNSATKTCAGTKPPAPKPPVPKPPTPKPSAPKPPTPTLKQVPWPSASDMSPFGQAVNIYKKRIRETHSKANTPSDVEKYWGIYKIDDLYFIIRKSGNISEKLKSYLRSWTHGVKLSNRIHGRVSAAQENNIKKYFATPGKYGGITPFIESDLDLGAHAGAYAAPAKIGNDEVTVVFSLYPIRPNEIPAGNTIADKRFGIFIHELSHVGCGSGACSGLDKTGHGGEQVVIDNTLRDISAKTGLKPLNPPAPKPKPPAPKPPVPKPPAPKPQPPAPKPVINRPEKNRSKYVGLFVSVWHNIPSMQQFRVMGKTDRYEKPAFYWWGEPAFGFKGYNWDNVKMIDYHIDNWIKLGVDFVHLDLTNGLQTDIVEGARKLLNRMATRSGPRVVFWIQKPADAKFFWDNFYNKYPKDLFFNYLGKPLLLLAGTTDNVGKVTSGKQVPIPRGGALDNFTVRWMWALSGAPDSMWSFKEFQPNPKPYMYNGKPEQLGLTIATQQTGMTITTDPFRRGRNNGKYFQEQVKNARKYNPKFITIQSYNEWAAQNLSDDPKKPLFIDAASPEYSGDIEPMKGGFGDKYFNMVRDFIKEWR